MTAEPYVFVVHGTWNPPVDGRRLWYQLDDGTSGNFCHQLNDELDRLGAGRPVWRSWQTEPNSFDWSGANQHEDRIQAGDRLFTRWLDLIASDPAGRIHVVSHSHGGNVTLRAVQRYLDHLEDEANQIAERAETEAEHCSPSEAVTRAVRHQFGDRAGQILHDCTETLTLLEGDPLRPDGPSSDDSASTTDTHILGRFSGKLQSLRERIGSRLERRRKQSETVESSGSTVGIEPFNQLLDGAHRWTQSSIEKSHARKRKRSIRSAKKEFVMAWIASQSSNRLGSLCFLGTPFMTKTWAQYTWWVPNVIASRLLDLMAAIFIGTIGSYLGVLLVWGELWVLLSAVMWVFGYGTFVAPELQPLEWPLWLQIAAGLYLVSISIGIAITFGDNSKQTNFNPYFDRPVVNKPPKISDANLPLATLVVNAGVLDEAFLGYSSEPLVYGGLQPQLYALAGDKSAPLAKRLMTPAFWLPPKSVLKVQSPSNPLAAFLRWAWHCVMVLPRTFIAMPTIVWLWDRHLTRRLVRLISAYAFGVPAHEFAGALIVAKNRLDRPDVFREITSDVTKILVETASFQVETIHQRATRYQFLWDDDELERRKEASKLWANLALLVPAISKRYRWFPGVSGSDLEQRLAKTSIVLEERMRELVGAVELVHCSYYSNPRIIEEIAKFIAEVSKGKPDEAMSGAAT